MFKRLRALIILAGFCAACGGSPPTGGVDICAMNPIAHGCSLESVQGPLTGGFKTNQVFLQPVQEYLCNGAVNAFSGVLQVGPFTLFGQQFWEANFMPVNWANPLNSRNSLKWRTSNQLQGLVPAMDGPFHVLYNPTSFFPIGLVTSANGDPNLKPVIIPPYGLWIYAPNERPDYPNGATIVTLDPDFSVPMVPGDGRCPSRVQFIFPL
jgi:hypothetical protein